MSSNTNGLAVNVQIRLSATQLATLPCDLIKAMTDLASSAIGLNAIAARVQTKGTIEQTERDLQVLHRARACIEWVEKKGHNITDDFQIIESDAGSQGDGSVAEREEN